MSDPDKQADANLIYLTNEQVILIDSGQRSDRLLPRLKDRKVTRIDKIFISHPHKDHYDGIPSLLNGGISLGEVYLNWPPQTTCDSEIPWGCDLKDLEQLKAKLATFGITLKSMNPGDVYFKSDVTELKTLYAHDGQIPPVGPTDINDLSVIMSLRHGDTTALFTGDLNKKMGSYLAGLNDPKLRANLLKVPHHGTESLAPDSFFEWVNPQAAFVPAPLSLWQSERSKRPREWFQSHQIPTYVTGEVGAVMIDILPSGYTIKSSK